MDSGKDCHVKPNLWKPLMIGPIISTANTKRMWFFLISARLLTRCPTGSCFTSLSTLASQVRLTHGFKPSLPVDLSQYVWMVQLHLQPAFFPGSRKVQCLDLCCSCCISMILVMVFYHLFGSLQMIVFCTVRFRQERTTQCCNKTCQHYHNEQNCGTCLSMWRSVHTCTSPWSGNPP